MGAVKRENTAIVVVVIVLWEIPQSIPTLLYFCTKAPHPSHMGYSVLSTQTFGKGDKWRPPTRGRTFGARHLALWTFGARTIGGLDNWHPGHFAPGHLAVETIGALENWRSGTFGAQTFGAPDVWRPKKIAI